MAGITCARSEKVEKQVASRRAHRVNREILNASNDDSLLKDRRATGNPWNMSKDGKQFFNPEIHPKLMRK